MSPADHASRGAVYARGGVLALVAACAFGATAPLVQRFGAHLGPFETAALLYAGAAIASGIPLPGASSVGAPLRASNAGRILLVAIAGALVAPVCLAWGVQRTSATGASLLLNLEGLFTVLLARAFYREPIGPRVGFALAAMGAGGVVLVLARGGEGATSTLGALAVAGATLAWAADNLLTRPLAELEPSRVVLAKSSLGVLLASGLALAAREPVPPLAAALPLLACGGAGYGASLRLYLAAQRALGAARTASIFAAAPFVGALVAIALGDRPPALATGLAAALCAAGVVLHLTEHHSHAHSHAPLLHEHAHRHDDGHHDHVHDPPVAGEHSHPHRHEGITHEHDHAPDVHHGHDHTG
ncbi:MAG: DMT family transporter [Polyangiaceae bacterium]